LFTENETNRKRLFGAPNASPYVKDAFHHAVIDRRDDLVNPARQGSKAAAHYQAVVAPGAAMTARTRLSNSPLSDPSGRFDLIQRRRIDEADEFYRAIQPLDLDDERRRVQRQAYAGLLWSKQFYHYSAELWLNGDPAGPEPPQQRRRGRNAGWGHA